MGPRLLVVDEIGYLPFGREEANQFFNSSTWCHGRCRGPNLRKKMPTISHCTNL